MATIKALVTGPADRLVLEAAVREADKELNVGLQRQVSRRVGAEDAAGVTTSVGRPTGQHR
jgi:hypothetical protein